MVIVRIDVDTLNYIKDTRCLRNIVLAIDLC